MPGPPFSSHPDLAYSRPPAAGPRRGPAATVPMFGSGASGDEHRQELSVLADRAAVSSVGPGCGVDPAVWTPFTSWKCDWTSSSHQFGEMSSFAFTTPEDSHSPGVDAGRRGHPRHGPDRPLAMSYTRTRL